MGRNPIGEAAAEEIIAIRENWHTKNHPFFVEFSEGKFSLNVESLELKSPKGDISLTALEADVMKEFMTNPGKVLTRKQLLETVWGLKGSVETRTVDNFIMRLRKHIESDPAKPLHLESVRGRGYRFNPNE